MQEIENLKTQVETILREFPESRNSDITLMIELWKRYYPDTVITEGLYLKDLYDLPRESAIGRVRRSIQNDAKRTAEMRYLPTSKEVAKQRGINESIWWLAMQNKTN